MLYTSPVWTPLRFDEDGVKEVSSKFFSTLKNTYNFFVMYANIDDIDPKEYEIKYDDLEEIDKWLLSKYNKLVKNMTKEIKKLIDFNNIDDSMINIENYFKSNNGTCE